MKKMIRLLCLLLVAVMVIALVAGCKKKDDPEDPTNPNNPSNPSNPSAFARLGMTDEEIYDMILGEFYEAYAAAKAAPTVAMRYALMAVAEAKLMEAGIMMPLQANGGNYAISKVVPYTITPVLWGNDSDRYHNALVCTTPIKAEDRDALKAIYKEVQGSGTYETKAKEYLAAHGYTVQRTYTIGYTSDPLSWDVLASSEAIDAEVLVNTYDGLLEYDGEGNLKGALAERWEVSDDGLVWTFHIRQGAKWVDSEGRELAEVTADDFVAGLQHMLDAAGGLEYLVEGIIVGVEDYLYEVTTDFSEVGVKAIDKYTLQYTLEAPCSYFDTMFGYGVFAPMLRSFYTGLGGQFGIGESAGKYGTSKDTIAYCGPYIVDIFASESQIHFQKNTSYWNAANINIDEINWVYNDGTVATKAYDDFKAGVLDGCGLNAAALEKANEDNLYVDCIYVSGTDATSFPGFFNLSRKAYANYNDATKMISSQTDAMKTRATWAMLNTNFRLALAMSLNRAQYMAASVGEDLKYASMVNSYTPGTFVKLPADVTIQINGVARTFEKDTYYGEIMQAQIEADGFPAMVWNKDADGGVGSSGGYDGWYNPTEAVKYLNKAIEELAVVGVEVSADNPIHIDYACRFASDVQIAMAMAVKNSIEENLGRKVVVDLVATTVSTDYSAATYSFRTGAQANYNISLNSGWGPDYGDPSTYLDTMTKGGGYMLKCMGLDC